MTAFKHWHYETDKDNIVWFTFDKAGESANTLSAGAMQELGTAIDAITAANPRGLIIRSGKASGFIAGADIEEFTQVKSPQEAQAQALARRGWDLYNRIAALPYPTVALVNGFCMGGGTELALACRYRVVVDDPKTKLALPEVMLGIVPAWGGVMRLPKIVGAPTALDMMLTGRSIDARRAQKIGLADACVPERVHENAARSFVLEKPAPRVLPLLQALLLKWPLRSLVAWKARQGVAAKARPEHYPAPYAILELFEKHDGDPFDIPAGSPATMEALLTGDTAQNLVRVFFLQERLKKLGKTNDFKVRHVHVVGAGTMGGDIAAWCALRGLTVTLQDQNAERIAPAIGRAALLYQRRLKEKLRVRDTLDRLIPDPHGYGVARADVIIEAIFENLEVKQKLFADLEARARPDCILATNTSSLKLEDIAVSLQAPQRLIGLHFFNPVAQMQLVEVIDGQGTDAELIRRGMAFVRQIDKLPLPVKSAPGFLVNRVLGPYLNEAFLMVGDGIKPETIDACAVRFGMPMGPIELADTVGLDICLAVSKILSAPVPAALTALIAAGHLGRKTGQGFYTYRAGKPVKQAAEPVTEALMERLMSPYLKEAQTVQAEGIVADADLIDAGLIFGTGFAPFRGGPLHYIQSRQKTNNV